MKAYFQVACFNCQRAGNCDTKGIFEAEEDFIPCYSFNPKIDILTSAIKAARVMIPAILANVNTSLCISVDKDTENKES